jgi:hypothetical protein
MSRQCKEQHVLPLLAYWPGPEHLYSWQPCEWLRWTRAWSSTGGTWYNTLNKLFTETGFRQKKICRIEARTRINTKKYGEYRYILRKKCMYRYLQKRACYCMLHALHTSEQLQWKYGKIICVPLLKPLVEKKIQLAMLLWKATDLLWSQIHCWPLVRNR